MREPRAGLAAQSAERQAKPAKCLGVAMARSVLSRGGRGAAGAEHSRRPLVGVGQRVQDAGRTGFSVTGSLSIELVP
jgi:hypothetical protein